MNCCYIFWELSKHIIRPFKITTKINTFTVGNHRFPSTIWTRKQIECKQLVHFFSQICLKISRGEHCSNVHLYNQFIDNIQEDITHSVNCIPIYYFFRKTRLQTLYWNICVQGIMFKTQSSRTTSGFEIPSRTGHEP